MKSSDLLRRDYEEAYAREIAREYPEVDAFESRHGYAVMRARLECAARVLACPVKANPPNWQHGRVLYSLARKYLETQHDHVLFLDIGTAKGFSAVVMSWAIADAERSASARVESVDIVDPEMLVKRNSVIECDTLYTVYQFTAPFVAPATDVRFYGGGSANWLGLAARAGRRIGFAFVDGKHTHDAVMFEALQVAKLQRPGDVIVFDDMQIKDLAKAVVNLKGYRREWLHLTGAYRSYGIAIKC